MSKRWDKEADVLAVDYRLAGAVAVVEAHDSGADVIILEKSQYPGGCSIFSAGMVLCAYNVEGAAEEPLV